jgi:protein-L-isoaspartate(D-aspartate) O-methyltransferase
MSMNTADAFAREQMVAQQIRAWDVLDDGILELFRRLPRESFVPAAYRDAAYADFPIPLGDGQHMLAPSLAGRLLQALDVQPGERVLEIGTGSGFLSACLALQGGKVTSVEIRPRLADHARANLAAAGIPGVDVRHADLYPMLDGADRFDAIALTGSLPEYDARLESLLQPEGRLFAVVGTGQFMEARLVTRLASGDRREDSLFETRLDSLDHARRPGLFEF